MKKYLSLIVLFFAGFFPLVSLTSTLQISVQDRLNGENLNGKKITITLSGNSAGDIEYNIKQPVRFRRMVISNNSSP